MKRKWTYYITLMAGILIFTILVPLLIRAAATAFIGRFAPDAGTEEAETGIDDYRTAEGFTEAEGNGSGEGAAEPGSGSAENNPIPANTDYEHDPDLMKSELQKQKEQTDTNLSDYLAGQSPELSESRNGMLEAFVGDRQEAFIKAVADHLYGTYGSLFDITKIDVVDFIADNDTELTCQVKVTAVIGEKEYSEYYFCTFNKAYGFYGVYAYHE